MQIIDLHCDTIAKIVEENDGAALRQNSFCIDIEKLKQGESMAQFFALFVDQKQVQDAFVCAKSMLERFYQELSINKATIRFASNAADLAENRKNNKISAFLTIEEGGVLQGKIENLQEFYRRGVRLLTLTWNYPNELGYPNHKFVDQHKGLTSFGKECIREMNRLGMLIDVSHLSDQGFYDVAELSAEPFIASHSNSRELCPNSRNLTDEMIRGLAQRGGVMGLNFAAYFLGTGKFSKIDDMIRHIQHIHQVGGIDVIAIGSDFDGINPEIEIADFSQMQKLIDALQKKGFKESEIEKLAYRNALRVIINCLK